MKVVPPPCSLWDRKALQLQALSTRRRSLTVRTADGTVSRNIRVNTDPLKTTENAVVHIPGLRDEASVTHRKPETGNEALGHAYKARYFLMFTNKRLTKMVSTIAKTRTDSFV